MKMKIAGAMMLVLVAGNAMALSEKSNFADAKNLWNRSREVAAADINGNWQRIAVWEHADCNNVMRGESFDPKGIKNSDDTVFTLSFEGRQVRFLNVGGKQNTQGPYTVDSSRAVFSSWAYEGADVAKNMTDKAYGNYNCRALDSSGQLLCAVGTHLRENAPKDPVFEACSKLETGLMVLFKKAQD